MQHVVTPEGYLASHKQHQLLRAHLAGQTCAQRPGMREVERSVQPLKLAGHLSVVRAGFGARKTAVQNLLPGFLPSFFILPLPPLRPSILSVPQLTE